MNILHISAECYPAAKVGGLADVVGALPKYQNNVGHHAQVVMPLYNTDFFQKNSFKSIFKNTLKIGNNNVDYEVFTLVGNKLGFPLYFIKIPNLLFTDFVYSNDDSERFLAFQIAVLNWLLSWQKKPDIIHCHDHHTGLTPFLIQESFQYKSLKHIPTVVTIHNAQYQGWFSHDKIGLIPEFNLNNIGLLDWDNLINPLATAIKCAWRVTTVSPGYMEELKQNANGLESLLQHESAKCMGILNGIDTEVWNTETDPYLSKNYTYKTNVSGKKYHKKLLCKRFNLHPDLPLFIFIGRLVGEKGADLLPQVIDKALKENNINILVLGSGNKEIEKQLQDLVAKHTGKYNAFTGYDEKLSHLMYAGADFLLMPSRVEPCGLNQMYAMRYGTIPIVNSTGGLKDTVIDIDKGGYGIVHHKVSVNDSNKAIKKAVNFYKNQGIFRKKRKFVMQLDFSWNKSAKDYINIYQSLLNIK